MMSSSTKLDLLHLAELEECGVCWASRAKDNMLFRVKKNLAKAKGNIIKDQILVLTGKHKGMDFQIAGIAGFQIGRAHGLAGIRVAALHGPSEPVGT